MKPDQTCLIVLMVMLIGQAGTVQASDAADQAGVVPKRDASAHVLTSGEIDSSKVEVGAYVEVTYYKGEKLETVRGYIKAVDSETLTIGRGLWQEQIAFERIQRLIVGASDLSIDRYRVSVDLLNNKDPEKPATGQKVIFWYAYRVLLRRCGSLGRVVVARGSLCRCGGWLASRRAHWCEFGRSTRSVCIVIGR